MKFKSYHGNRFIAKCDEFYVIIQQENKAQTMSLSCPVCQVLLATHDDELAMLEYQCCDFCAVHFAHARKDLWKNGWRPSDELLNSVIRNKSNVSIKLD